jgi:hypothetical protein
MLRSLILRIAPYKFSAKPYIFDDIKYGIFQVCYGYLRKDAKILRPFTHFLSNDPERE